LICTPDIMSDRQLVPWGNTQWDDLVQEILVFGTDNNMAATMFSEMNYHRTLRRISRQHQINHRFNNHYRMEQRLDNSGNIYYRAEYSTHPIINIRLRKSFTSEPSMKKKKKKKKLTTKLMFSFADTTGNCVVCSEPTLEILSGCCGQSMCMECYKTWLKSSRQCCLCKADQCSFEIWKNSFRDETATGRFYDAHFRPYLYLI
jgi:hypothetical protein